MRIVFAFCQACIVFSSVGSPGKSYKFVPMTTGILQWYYVLWFHLELWWLLTTYWISCLSLNWIPENSNLRIETVLIGETFALDNRSINVILLSMFCWWYSSGQESYCRQLFRSVQNLLLTYHWSFGRVYLNSGYINGTPILSEIVQHYFV